MKKTIKNLIILGAMAGFIFTAGNAYAQYDTNTTVIPGATEAILNSSVNPNGTATSTWFKYGTDANMVYFSETPHTYVGSYTGEVPFSQKITALSPNTMYFYQAIANNGTMAEGQIMSFATVTNNNATASYNTNTYSNNNNNVVYTNTGSNNYVAPVNDNVSITGITATGAILNAVLTNPNHQSARGYFEWGTTKSFGYNTPMTELGTNYTSNFSGALTNLNPNTTYYFRAVVVFSNGKMLKGYTKDFQTFSSAVSAVNTNYAPQSPSVTTNQGQLIRNSMNSNVVSTNTNLSANSLFGASFLPNNIFGWLLLLIVILAIVWVIRKLTQPKTYVVQR